MEPGLKMCQTHGSSSIDIVPTKGRKKVIAINHPSTYHNKDKWWHGSTCYITISLGLLRKTGRLMVGYLTHLRIFPKSRTTNHSTPQDLKPLRYHERSKKQYSSFHFHQCCMHEKCLFLICNVRINLETEGKKGTQKRRIL